MSCGFRNLPYLCKSTFVLTRSMSSLGSLSSFQFRGIYVIVILPAAVVYQEYMRQLFN